MEKTMTEARADALMEDGFHCSQCVFPYAAFRLGMDRDEALRLSAGLGHHVFHGALEVFFQRQHGHVVVHAQQAVRLAGGRMRRKRISC